MSSSLRFLFLLFAATTTSLVVLVSGLTTLPPPATRARSTSPSSLMRMVDPSREAEIRRKIIMLKKAGKIKNIKKGSDGMDDDEEEDSSPSEVTALDRIKQQRKRLQQTNDYSDALNKKLGKKAQYLGLDTSSASSSNDDMEDETSSTSRRKTQLGSLSAAVPSSSDDDHMDDDDEVSSRMSSFETTEFNILDPSLFEDDDDDEPDLSEEELIELVAAKLQQKKDQKRRDEEQARLELAKKDNELKLQQQQQRQQQQQEQSSISSNQQQQTTTGVGGTWNKNETASNIETYQPKSGSWGAFPRPKDISKAYGGGRRVGAGIDKTSLLQSAQDTRERLRQYREKVGIEVQSEKDNAEAIERALAVSGYAMQRGMYSKAVAALEKVTKWCSTNSKVGGKVFLELAMAYEAEGRTQEAVTVYTTLTKCRIEEIKHNAKRLLYGIEAMEFMRNEARSSEFSRKKIRNTFIDTTGLANIAENFDDVYQTAYIDLEGGFYRRLTESVVRGNREARQILLKATGSGEVDRLKIVQALRSLSRHFDDALEEELKRAAPKKEPVAVMDGRPIVAETVETIAVGMDDFHLASPSDMMENLNGEWRLQLLADKRGDGVKYFNNTLSWQYVDTNSMSFQSSGPVGFIKVSERGDLEFQKDKRILTKTSVETKGNMLLSGLFRSNNAVGQAAPQQIVSVDSVLMITRASPPKKRGGGGGYSQDDIKDHFAVWRRVDEGTYSSRRGGG